MDGLQRGAAAIVGVAESDLGAVAADMSAIDLMAQGIHRALDDCGLGLSDVDGLICATAQSRTSGLKLAEYLGISPAFIDTTILGGSSFMFHVAHAQAALQLGLCKVAVIAYGSTQRTIGRRHASVREYNPYETPFRPFLPSTAYALAASRHMHQYGTTREQLAAVAVAAREWALLNPVAWEKKPLTIAEVLSARMISYPFTVRDICLVTDGGGAVIMTTAERARSLKKPPVYVLGCGQAITHANISSMPDLTVTGALPSGRAAYAMAGLAPKDIDVLELYDAFTINTILFLEDLGFCKKGEGGRLSPADALRPRSSAGQHQWRRTVLLPSRDVRAVSADRGDAAAARRMRRAPGRRCETAIAHGNGGVLRRRAPSSSGHKQRFEIGGAKWPKAHWFGLRMSTGSASSPSTTRRSTRSRRGARGHRRDVERGNADPAIKAMVLIGAGRSFIAGADIRQFGTRRPPPVRAGGRMKCSTRAPKPVVAAIHGYALGGGLEIALACHYRIAVPSAKVGLPEVLIGILPGAGGTQRLPRLIGPKAAMEMITSGRHVPAEEAHQLGIIDELVPEGGDLKAAAIAFARRVADTRPLPRIRDHDEKLAEGNRSRHLRSDAQVDRAARPQPERALCLHRGGRGRLHDAV